MSNVIAINAAAKKHIAAARATSDEMLLADIAKGNRTAMHVLYSRHNVRVYRFVLRIVRDTTMLVGVSVLVPLILAYTAWAYYVFRGKVRPESGYH